MDIIDLKAGFIIAKFFLFVFAFCLFLLPAIAFGDVRDFISDAKKCAERHIEQLFDIEWIDEKERKEAYDKLYGR